MPTLRLRINQSSQPRETTRMDPYLSYQLQDIPHRTTSTPLSTAPDNGPTAQADEFEVNLNPASNQQPATNGFPNHKQHHHPPSNPLLRQHLHSTLNLPPSKQSLRPGKPHSSAANARVPGTETNGRWEISTSPYHSYHIPQSPHFDNLFQPILLTRRTGHRLFSCALCPSLSICSN